MDSIISTPPPLLSFFAALTDSLLVELVKNVMKHKDISETDQGKEEKSKDNLEIEAGALNCAVLLSVMTCQVS